MGRPEADHAAFASARYNGFGVSVVGIIAYRGPYFGVYDTLKEKNPYKKDKGAPTATRTPACLRFQGP